MEWWHLGMIGMLALFALPIGLAVCAAIIGLGHVGRRMERYLESDPGPFQVWGGIWGVGVAVLIAVFLIGVYRGVY